MSLNSANKLKLWTIIKHLCRNMQSTRCVAPWFIVGREHSKVAATDKIVIVHWQQRAGGWQELRVEYNLRTHKRFPICLFGSIERDRHSKYYAKVRQWHGLFFETCWNSTYRMLYLPLCGHFWNWRAQYVWCWIGRDPWSHPACCEWSLEGGCASTPRV